MTPFEEVAPDPSSVDKTKRGMIEKFKQNPQWARQFIPEGELTEERFEEVITAVISSELNDSLMFRNDKYMVTVRKERCLIPDWPPLIHLSIRRLDRSPIHEWRDMQEIKNQLVGTESEAVELYPAESRRVDSANQYHLFVLDNQEKFPFGYQTRFVESDSIGSAVQRPLEEETK